VVAVEPVAAELVVDDDAGIAIVLVVVVPGEA